MISKATIANLKAFGEEQSINFAVDPRADVSKLTLLVGPNNSGKSSVVRTLDEVLTSYSEVFTVAKEHRHGEGLPKVEIRYGDLDVRVVDGLGSKFTIQGSVDRSKIRYVPSRRPWNESFSNIMDDAQYASNFRQNSRSQRYWVDSLFGSTLTSLSRHKHQKDDFDLLLKRADPSIRDWQPQTTASQDFIEYRTEMGGWHRIGDVGDGVSSLFRICYEIFFSKEGDTLIIDEPELSLHPQVQKNLARIMLDASFSRQFIVATHSPHFVSWKALEHGADVYRLNMTDEGSRVARLSEPTRKKILAIATWDKKNFMLYDAVAKEVFFSRGALFVEGAEDANILRLYIEENKLPQIEVFGYGSGGANNIENWLFMCHELGVPAFGLYDGDQKGCECYDLARKNGTLAANNQIKVSKLWTDDIRDKSAQDGQPPKVGIFDAKWKIKPEHEGKLRGLLSSITDHLASINKEP